MGYTLFVMLSVIKNYTSPFYAFKLNKIYLSIYLYIYLSICLDVYPSVRPSVHSSIRTHVLSPVRLLVLL